MLHVLTFVGVLTLAVAMPREGRAGKDDYCDYLRRNIMVGFMGLRSGGQQEQRAVSRLPPLIQLHELGACPKEPLNKGLICINEAASKAVADGGSADQIDRGRVQQCIAEAIKQAAPPRRP
jgi:hypothetical protein